MLQHDTLRGAWSPFTTSRRDIFNNNTLKMLSEKYNKTVTQFILSVLSH